MRVNEKFTEINYHQYISIKLNEPDQHESKSKTISQNHRKRVKLSQTHLEFMKINDDELTSSTIKEHS